jgi:uroporphyrinogen-III decarboxylase
MILTPLAVLLLLLLLHSCRYQAAYRELARKHPSFRERSETTELIVDISLQVRINVFY